MLNVPACVCAWLFVSVCVLLSKVCAHVCVCIMPALVIKTKTEQQTVSALSSMALSHALSHTSILALSCCGCSVTFSNIFGKVGNMLLCLLLSTSECVRPLTLTKILNQINQPNIWNYKIQNWVETNIK